VPTVTPASFFVGNVFELEEERSMRCVAWAYASVWPRVLGLREYTCRRDIYLNTSPHPHAGTTASTWAPSARRW
jgi:hypothetical protein